MLVRYILYIGNSLFRTFTLKFGIEHRFIRTMQSFIQAVTNSSLIIRR